MKIFNHKFSVAISTALLLALLLTTIGMAAVWTDQQDYSPGDIVTIHGDNSDGAGYLAGETVHVDVTGPNGYTATCDATANDNGAWSCPVTLWPDSMAVGTYNYAATGLTSHVTQSGTFTDGNLKFHETGLPNGTSWTVTWDNTSQTVIASNDIVFGGQDRTANYSVTSPLAGGAGVQYVASPASGTATRPGQGNTTVNIAFTTQYQVSFAVNPSGGGSTSPSTTAYYNAGSTVSVLATANTGYAFSSWSASTSSITFASASSASTTATINGPGTITANFYLIDNTPPVISYILTPSSPDGSNGWYKSNVTLVWSVTDPESAVIKTGCVDQNITADQSATAYTCSATSAGGSAGPVSVTIKRDATAPTEVSGAPNRAPDYNGWYNQAVDVVFTGTDGTSGIDTCTTVNYAGPDSADVTVNGTCTDEAGNTSTPVASSAFDYDATAPIGVSGAPNRPADHNGWYNHAVDVVFSGTDATSGIASCTSANYTGPDGEDVTVNGTCTDEAGNTSGAVAFTFKYDATPPTDVSGAPNRVPDHGNWYNHAVDVVFTGTDITSGIDSCTTVNYTGPDGTGKTVNGTCTDKAGNTSAPVASSAFDYDATAPTDVSGAPNRVPDHGNWYNHAVDVVFSGTDGTSGIDSCTTNHYSGPDGTGVTVNGTCTDEAGNTNAPVASSAFDYDATVPSVVISAPANGGIYILNAAVASNYTCSDATSGLDTCTGPVANGSNFDTSTVGSKNFTVIATDKAGNTYSATNSYSVQYASSGMCYGAPGHQILQPINIDGTSIFKQGSTVPAKFRVCDANGSSIGLPGVVTSFKLVKVVSGTTETAPNEDPVSTTPDIAFRWSASDQLWIFNISTKKLNANMTYYYEITLNDGSKITFNFGLK